MAERLRARLAGLLGLDPAEFWARCVICTGCAVVGAVVALILAH